jgi:glycosyltransferase involved in cell wall biosynthesis
MSSPAISVVIPCYNASRYLESALASVQVQTFTDFEIIVVDDGSTDNSKALLEAIASREPRLRIISRPNTGIVGALNDGLAAARGEFIARMDADDLCFPGRFEKQVAYLRAHPDCVCVGSYFNYIDDHGARVKWNPRETEHENLVANLLAGDGGSLIHPAILLRREAVIRVGGYRVEAQWVEDLDLYLRLAQIGRLANLPEVLFDYRYHSQSVNFTRNEGRHQRKLWVMEQAYAARALPFNRAAWPTPAVSTKPTAEDAQRFALDSLRFPGMSTPWRYAWRSIRLAPTDKKSWRVFGYILKITFGLIPRGNPS